MSRTRIALAAAGVFVACGLSFVAGARAQQQSIEGQVFRSAAGTELAMLLDGRGRDGDVDVGVITFPAGTPGGDHRHGVTEIFYVLEGRLEHVVNGESQILEPGMLGFVEPPDAVSHITEDGGPTRALVIWSPAGEGARIASNWERVR